MKHCYRCDTTKEDIDFHRNKKQPDGLQTYCKECRKSYDKKWVEKNRDKVLEWKRQANANLSDESRANKNALNRMRAKRTKVATPLWFDKEEVKYIYDLAVERGLVVDHIVPLQHELVCGLHVQDNLRCIPREMNARKSNKFNQDFL